MAVFILKGGVNGARNNSNVMHDLSSASPDIADHADRTETDRLLSQGD